MVVSLELLEVLLEELVLTHLARGVVVRARSELRVVPVQLAPLRDEKLLHVLLPFNDQILCYLLIPDPKSEELGKVLKDEPLESPFTTVTHVTDSLLANQ